MEKRKEKQKKTFYCFNPATGKVLPMGGTHIRSVEVNKNDKMSPIKSPCRRNILSK
jgi:hypothetical protein